jgi:signal transduction histidine kinase
MRFVALRLDIMERKRAEELEAQMAHERAMFLEEKTRLAGEIHDSLAQSFRCQIKCDWP